MSSGEVGRTRSPATHAGWVVEVASLAVVAATVVVSLGWPVTAGRLAVPVAVLAVLVGVPHGAVDGALLATAEPTAGRRAAWVYLAVFAAVGAAVWLATVPAVLVLLVAAVVHFGLGEVEYADAGPTRPGRSAGSWERVAAVVGSGGVVVAVPFAVHPQPVNSVLAALSPGLVTALSPGVRWTAAAVAVACLAVTVACRVLSRRLREAGEGLLLLVMAFVAPPVLSFAVFFGAWHSLRHLTRLLQPGTATIAGVAPSSGGLNRRVVVWSAAASVAVVAVVAAGLAWSGVATVRLLALLVAGLLALTVPHATAVAWFDTTHRRCPDLTA